MTNEVVAELLEKGDARCIYTAVLLVVYEGVVWFSFDGHNWSSTIDPVVIKATEVDA